MIESLSVITLDDIKRLRREGKLVEAQQLLNAFHDNKQKNKEQLSKEIRRQERRKEAYLRKISGVCLMCPQDAIPHRVLCVGCAKKWSLYQLKRYYQKQQGI